MGRRLPSFASVASTPASSSRAPSTTSSRLGRSTHSATVSTPPPAMPPGLAPPGLPPQFGAYSRFRAGQVLLSRRGAGLDALVCAPQAYDYMEADEPRRRPQRLSRISSIMLRAQPPSGAVADHAASMKVPIRTQQSLCMTSLVPTARWQSRKVRGIDTMRRDWTLI